MIIPGAYIARDFRQGGAKRCPVVVTVGHADNGRLALKYISSMGGEIVAVDDEHPDFVWDEDEGLIVLPVPYGRIELFWPTLERYSELDTSLEFPEVPDLRTEEEIQALLTSMCYGM